MACPSLDQMVNDYAANGVRSVFVYIREAHPGEHFCHHTTIEQKIAYAREFQRHFQVQRPILVDDLYGTAHSAFGRQPNMTYILNRAHRIVYRANWTDPTSIRWALDYLIDAQARRREGLRLAPFYAEVQGYRWVNDEQFFNGLELAGDRAVKEFREARAQWARGEHLGSIKNPNFS